MKIVFLMQICFHLVITILIGIIDSLKLMVITIINECVIDHKYQRSWIAYDKNLKIIELVTVTTVTMVTSVLTMVLTVTKLKNYF